MRTFAQLTRVPLITFRLLRSTSITGYGSSRLVLSLPMIWPTEHCWVGERTHVVDNLIAVILIYRPEQETATS